LIGIFAAVAAIGLAFYGIADRAKSKQETQIWTNEQANPRVTLVQPQQGPSEGDALPGAFYADPPSKMGRFVLFS
jgi:hypothetical protein